MADAHPNLNLTAEEKRVFYQLFQTADKTNLGVVTGEVAVTFFEKTNLPAETLGLIWQIADKQNRGLLTPSGFGIVLRLIGHAQAGRPPTEELAYQPGPLPKFVGISLDGQNTQPAPPLTTSSPPPPTPLARVPQLNQDDIAKFTALFERSDTQDGLISGETAKQIFERARLPNEVLGRIWNLADTKQRGTLDMVEFIIAMHLLTAYKTGAMRAVPPSLPPGLYEAATRRGSIRSSGSRPSSEVPPVPAIPKQFTGPQRTQSPLNRPPISPLSAHGTGLDWLITPQEKAHFDSIFATIDKRKTGFLSGDDAVGFFANAQLHEDTLAQIWDLADIDSDGQLSKEEFAVAMYLVRQQRSSKEPLPQALPPALIPPSMRRQAAPPPRPMQSQVTGTRSAAEDLFGLDVFTAPIQTSQSTGGSNAPFPNPSSPVRAAPAPPMPPPTTFKPFVPSSSFGQSLTPHTTGVPNTTAAQPRSPAPNADDLLGDADPEESKKLTQETTDLANLSNQVSTLSNEMANVQAQRGNAEQDLAQTNRQKRDFEGRLAQARAMYEQEVKDFKALEERLTTSKAETAKLQQEFAMIDGSRQDLQNQFNQVSAALEADQGDNANLKEKIRQVNAQISQLKPQLEKLRSEARQQKGLAAINKKQLATVEGERDRIQGEIDSANTDQPEPDRQASNPPTSASPAASMASQGTNPFLKRSPTASSDQALSPTPTGTAAKSNPQSIFDNMFGPAFSSPPTMSPPPPTTFRSETSTPQPQQGGNLSKALTSPELCNHSSSPSAAMGHMPDPTEPPPPPPRSRQISSSVLPIEGHQESKSSSTKASPPASGIGGESHPELMKATPGSQLTSPFEEGDPFAGDPKSPETETAPPATLPSSTPGAFPAATPDAEAAQKDYSFDELFAGRTHTRSQSQKALDFKEAFATMKKDPRKNNVDTTASQSVEFPPITELEDDDDTTDSEAPTGFDDDFTPVSPDKGKGKATQPIVPAEAAQEPEPSLKKAVTEEPPEAHPLGKGGSAAPADVSHSFDQKTPAPMTGGLPKPPTGVSKKLPTDFEAAFAGLDLTPAKEAEEDDEEDDFESPFNKDPSNFDMTFDSPSAGKQGTRAASGSAPGAPNFFSFNTSSSRPQTAGNPPETSSTPTPQPSSRDWDALFSVLDEAKGKDEGGAADPNAPKAAIPPTSTVPAHATVPATANAPAQAKPPGWALNAESGEDDMILKRLTSMGYPRDESLAALEKFDYNIDKAADFLATKT